MSAKKTSTKKPSTDKPPAADSELKVPSRSVTDELCGRMETLLKKMVAAMRTQAFYPADNPSVVEALAACQEVVDSFFEMVSQMEELLEGTAIGIYKMGDRHGVSVTVGRHGFIMGSEPVGSPDSILSRFAQDLFVVDVKTLQIEEGTTTEEIESFLRLVNSDPEQLIADGGLPQVMDTVPGDHLIVKSAPLLDVLDAETASDLGLVMEEACQHSTLPETELVEAKELFEFLSQLTREDASSRSELLTLIRTRGQSIDPEVRSPDEDDEFDVEMIRYRSFLDRIKGILASVPSRVRRRVAGSIVENLSVESGALGGREGEELNRYLDVRSRLLDSISDDEIAGVLSEKVQVHRGTTSAITNFLRHLSGTPERVKNVRNLMKKNLKDVDIDLEKVMEVFDGASVDMSGAKAAPKKQVVDMTKAEQEREELESKLTMEKGERAAIIEEMRGAPSVDSWEFLIEMSGLLDIDPSDQMLKGVSSLVSREVTQSIQQDNLTEASEHLKRFQEETRIPEASKQNVMIHLKQIDVTELPEEQVDKLLEDIQLLDSNSPDFKQKVALLGVMGGSAYRFIFDRLVLEESRRMRQLLLTVLQELGDAHVPFLLEQLEHSEWYVVRNVVHILGRLGNEEAVVSLEAGILHEEPRVRQETLNALGRIKGDSALSLITGAMEDKEEAIQKSAAEWLGLLKRTESTDPLLKAFRDYARFPYPRPGFTCAIIESLTAIGSRRALEPIRRIAKKRGLMPNQSALEVKRKAEVCLVQLEKKFPDS